VALSDSLLSDELLRQLMAVGQVDVVVGLPTLDNAASVGPVVAAVHTAFSTQLKRERTVLLNFDGGSQDGTPEIVREASHVAGDTLIASRPLRTTHRISAPYHGIPGKGGALRRLFAAAELLDARAVALVDPDVTSIGPDWIARLVRPVLRGELDYVAPVFTRAPSEAPLVTQLARPLVRAAYGLRLREPLSSELGCSTTFAAHCMGQDVWSAPFLSYGIDVWLTTTALAGGFRCGQTTLGPRVQAPHATRPGLPELFRQVVGALFTCLEIHADHWLARSASQPAPGDDETGVLASDEAPDPGPLAEAFRAGVRDLEPVLARILDAETAEHVHAAAAAPVLEYPDALWAATVYQFAAAHHRALIHRDHLVQSLVPLYLGRTAAFLAHVRGLGPAALAADFEALCLEYERAKPDLVRRWSAPEGG
jgi:hypothetical protein